MFSGSSIPRKYGVPAAAISLAAMVSACAVAPPPPEKVDESRPTVTYRYSSDQELVDVRPRAADHCARFNAIPQTQSLTTAPDGKRVVVFECIESAGALAPPLKPSSDLTYTYTSDRELLDAMQRANDYCRRNGARDVETNITTRPNGVKTVRFRCSPA